MPLPTILCISNECPDSMACDTDSNECKSAWDESIRCPTEPCGTHAYCNSTGQCSPYTSPGKVCSLDSDCGKYNTRLDY